MMRQAIYKSGLSLDFEFVDNSESDFTGDDAYLRRVLPFWRSLNLSKGCTVVLDDVAQGCRENTKLDLMIRRRSEYVEHLQNAPIALMGILIPPSRNVEDIYYGEVLCQTEFDLMTLASRTFSGLTKISDNSGGREKILEIYTNI